MKLVSGEYHAVMVRLHRASPKSLSQNTRLGAKDYSGDVGVRRMLRSWRGSIRLRR